MRPSLLLVPLLAALLLAAPGTAYADPDDGPVGLSADGQDYAGALEGPLFAASLRWVPGDRRSTSWWVRNEATDPALLAVEVPEDAVLPSWLTVEARTGSAGSTSSTWTPVATGRSLEAGILDTGATRRVDLRVGMRPGAGNRTMTEAADLRLRVRLTEDDRGVGPGGEGPGGEDPDGSGPGDDGVGDDLGAGGEDGVLPGTGSPLGLLSLLLGLLMVGVGVALLRRTDDEDPHPAHDRDSPAPDRERQEVAP